MQERLIYWSFGQTQNNINTQKLSLINLLSGHKSITCSLPMPFCCVRKSFSTIILPSDMSTPATSQGKSRI